MTITQIKSAAGIVALAAIGMFIGDLVARKIEIQPTAVAAAANDGVLRARQFELVDASNRVRAVIGFSGEGSPALWFFDQNGKSRLNLGVYGDGNPMIVLNDDHEEAVQIFRTVDNAPVLVMKAQGTNRIVLGLDPSHEPYFDYYDAHGGKHAVFEPKR